MNKERLKQIIDHIEAHPETWNQGDWRCGTTHCLAGHAQIMSGKFANLSTVRYDARIWLELSLRGANYLFAPERTVADFKTAVESPANFDLSGFDNDGFDNDGFNLSGFDRDGFSRSGFDLDGFDRDGLDVNLKTQKVAEND